MKDHSPAIVYQEQIQRHTAILNSFLRKRNLFGWLRLIVFVATIIISYKIFVDSGWFGLVPALSGIGTFLYLIFTDATNNEKITNAKTIIQINKEELKILNNDYLHRDDGSNFSPSLHDYANDLDLFGKASIFQWANRCSSEQGKNLLAGNLLNRLAVLRMEERQEAIKAIAPMIQWRQQFQSFSQQTIITTTTEEKTNKWLSEEEKYFISAAWKIFIWIYTVIAVASAMATIFGVLSMSVFVSLFLLYLTISSILSRNTIKPYLQLSRIVEEITTLERLINWVENKNFNTTLLKQIQENITSGNGKASAQVRELKSILDRFDLRISMIGPVFLNSFLLWDVQQMMALNEWRRKNKQLVPKLFETIAQVEVLNSLSSIHFNHPDWCLPKFVNEHFVFASEDLGHPLIPASERINNDFDINNKLISLVTGSNMAGKSTFLRSIGVNIVLAQMGAPVCAKSFTLSPVRLMTSMRISDNLAENTSTFYAELKKLKTIIEAVNRHENVFILLDEILRGTNSHDRHTGSAAFITQMIKHNAFAVIATHDLQLAELKKQYPEAIENHHFDVQVKGEELFFDYKLKHGVCHSLNASLLMKKIGIELPE